MGWPRPKANGILGLWYPWLIKSESLHYGFAVVMLIGIWVLRKGFTGRARTWWTVALVIQFWHHVEHFLLIWQATAHHNFWHKPVPFSVLQLVFPRVELHLFYNSVVFVPMVIGMYYHMFPPKGETQHSTCTCEWRPRTREGLSRLDRAGFSFRVRGLLITGCRKDSDRLRRLRCSLEDYATARSSWRRYRLAEPDGCRCQTCYGARVDLEGDMAHPGMEPVFGKTEETQPGRYQGHLVTHDGWRLGCAGAYHARQR